ncbi:M20 family peptidase [Clostridium sp. OM02-18AC]|uniref:M20 family metallopeptidase n=1 Tax=Clostridium sp. OM02-18AC TaxID=2292311 RepID=UPI000E479EBE|nr:M20 family metallopeptidase [Clostridium sp. OM02-18AC]RHV67494.1 M20 family peptidase [Clostridium sp. OM02-18AC]
MKQKIKDFVEELLPELADMADKIYDRPEMAFQEKFAAGVLEDWLEVRGFLVQRGLGTLNTAFRAEYTQGSGGPRIGLLCEYDALPNGHACGHQLQGPAILGAAAAIVQLFTEQSYSLIVYGTPAEEGKGGKVIMLNEGYLKDMDIALMMHGGPATQTDIKSMAKISATVTFHGKSAHAALKPEAGRSALDAMLLSFQGIEFLREHVREDSRMHYAISDGGGAMNVVPAKAVGEYGLRSYDSVYLDELIRRFELVVKGAAMMTETTCDICYHQRIEGKIPARKLNELLMRNAVFYNAPNCKPDREKTGSTDFANVMHMIPGACIRVAFVPEGSSSHSQEYLDWGKTLQAHHAIALGSQILAATVYDLLTDDEKFRAVQDDFTYQKELIMKNRI